MNAHITQTLQTSCDIDPLRYGWSIGGGIVDVLTPYEQTRRTTSNRTITKQQLEQDTYSTNTAPIEVIAIHIRFPLTNADEYGSDDYNSVTDTYEDGINNVNTTTTEVHYFDQYIHWNIHTMPSAIEYATNMATEYGLTYHDALILEEYITSQLTRARSIRAMPYGMKCVTLRDAMGRKRQNIGNTAVSEYSSRFQGSSKRRCGKINTRVREDMSTMPVLRHDENIQIVEQQGSDMITITLPKSRPPSSSTVASTTITSLSTNGAAAAAGGGDTLSIAGLVWNNESSSQRVPLQYIPYERSSQNYISSFESSSVSNAPSSNESNARYCIQCSGPGTETRELIYCSTCPRSYHACCLTSIYLSTEDVSSIQAINVSPAKNIQEKWRCTPCRANHVPDLVTDQQLSMSTQKCLSSSYSDSNAQSIRVRLLTLLLNILHTLRYHTTFGNVFAHPITCMRYVRIVHHPMDYSTLTQQILFLLQPQDKSVTVTSHDDMKSIIGAVKNIYLIYHNCALYNPVHSAVYNMGQLQYHYFDHYFRNYVAPLLSTQQRETLKLYDQELISRRDKAKLMPHADRLPMHMAVHADVRCPPFPTIATTTTSHPTYTYTYLSSTPTVSRNNTGSTKGSKGSSVIVLNPDTDTIVRRYSTLKVAFQAIQEVQQRAGYDSIGVRAIVSSSSPTENATVSPYVISEYQWRKVLHNARTNPHVRLFGYRWVLYDDLLTSSYCPTHHSNTNSNDNSSSNNGSNSSTSNRRSTNNTSSHVLRSSSNSTNINTNIQQRRTLTIPRPQSHHCNAYLTNKRAYCRRKLVSGSNYCGLHLYLPSSSSQQQQQLHKQQGSSTCIHVSPTIEPAPSKSKNKKLKSTVASISKASSTLIPTTTMTATDIPVSIMNTSEKSSALDVSAPTSTSTSSDIPIVAISLATQTTMHRWPSIQHASHSTGMASSTIHNILRSQVPVREVLYAKAQDEAGILQKIRDIVHRGGVYNGPLEYDIM